MKKIYNQRHCSSSFGTILVVCVRGQRNRIKHENLISSPVKPHSPDTVNVSLKPDDFTPYGDYYKAFTPSGKLIILSASMNPSSSRSSWKIPYLNSTSYFYFSCL